jgi:hypothetical protein
MKRGFLTVAIVALSLAPVAADLTITTTTTLEGAMFAGGGAPPVPKVVTRIRGSKSRTDVDLGDQSITTIVDMATNQTYLLRHDQKTAQLLDPAGADTAGAAAGRMAMPDIKASVKPTGQKRQLEGTSCDEYAIAMTMDMAAMSVGRSDMPPEAAALMKALKINIKGSTWVAKAAPGAAEYAKFQTAAAKLAMAAFGGAGGAAPGMPRLPNAMEQLLTGFSEAPGIPYLTDLTMVMDAGAGPAGAMAQQMGQMKIVSRVTAVSVDPVADSMFSIPEGYKVVKP